MCVFLVALVGIVHVVLQLHSLSSWRFAFRRACSSSKFKSYWIPKSNLRFHMQFREIDLSSHIVIQLKEKGTSIFQVYHKKLSSQVTADMFWDVALQTDSKYFIGQCNFHRLRYLRTESYYLFLSMTSKVTLWIFSWGRSVSKIIISHHSTHWGYFHQGLKKLKISCLRRSTLAFILGGGHGRVDIFISNPKKVESLKFCWRSLVNRNSNRTWYFDSHSPVQVRLLILQWHVYVYIYISLTIFTVSFE